ncbi:MAG TPA: glycosyltransferase family 4 protein [Chitinophagaceae bacterium]|nr:glycosyltransferase family 4 protein [Chitinophagaceae bacterium]
MKIVFTSYAASPEYREPLSWLKRIEGYTGILESLGKHHEVTSIERINFEGKLRQNGVDYLFTRQKKKIKRFPRAIHHLIDEIQPDAIFINGILFPFQLIQLRRKLGKRAKIIVIHRSEKPPKGLKKFLLKWADPHVNAYLFSSLEFGADWKPFIDVGKIRELGVASSVFYPIEKSSAKEITKVNGSPVYLWVGSLIPRKDPMTVVKAFLEFLRMQPGARLYMIYKSGQLLEEVQQFTDQFPEGKGSIVFVGGVAHDNLLFWYNSADYFIATSLYEGIGVALSEAMSCGCIPIVTDIPSFRKMTGPKACGLIFQPGSRADLLKKLMQTRNMDVEKEKRLTIGQFKKELSFEAISEKIMYLLNTI